MDPLVISTARLYADSEDPNIKAMAVEILRQAGAQPEDGMFYPATQTINRITDVPTDDHKALVIRLELQFWEYGILERYVRMTIESLRKREEELNAYAKRIASGEEMLPAPLRPEIIEQAKVAARDDTQRAEAFLKKIARPSR